MMLGAGLHEDREKKPRKEKKDKEREDKEKREKDRSDRKHRGKKDKKEKLREKKEKDRKKSSVSDEKRLPGQAKLGNGGDKASGEGKLPGQSKQINGDKALDGRKLPEKSEGNRGEIGAQKGKERDEEKNKISGEKFAGKFSGYNGQKLIQINSNLSHHTRDSKFVQELGRRARDEDRNQFLEKFPGTVAKGDEGMVRLVAIDPGNWVDGKEKNKRDDDRKMDGQGIRDEARFTGTALSLSATFQTRCDETLRPLEKGIEKMEGKDKSKQKENNDKRKYKEKKGKEKDKVRDKEKKREKSKEKSEHKKKEQDELKESGRSDVVANNSIKSSHLPKEITSSAVDEVNIKKRKDADTNGFLHANDIKPNKLPRPVSSLPLSAEMGRMPGTCQDPTAAIRGKQEAVKSDKVDTKGHEINGLIEAQALSISSTTQLLSVSLMKPFHSTAQTDQIAEVSRKQPHPDSKYLLEVLAVPKMEDCSDFEDQEWLFQSANSQEKKPKVGFSGVDKTPLVWSEALHIESGDVYALPYVIPY
ncbi:MYB-LIKE PROTEIN X [Salix koriyanagi]|uniref:MYB-LIKE PROTEIN X n=1 Tax=Salix koriyanagi TaxID=2511006 RepID=A0A9Q0X2Z5_9ROSI|nr:MYB-LIKE PROTEIN X [Salix koriyanagi]